MAPCSRSVPACLATEPGRECSGRGVRAAVASNEALSGTYGPFQSGVRRTRPKPSPAMVRGACTPSASEGERTLAGRGWPLVPTDLPSAAAGRSDCFAERLVCRWAKVEKQVADSIPLRGAQRPVVTEPPPWWRGCVPGTRVRVACKTTSNGNTGQKAFEQGTASNAHASPSIRARGRTFAKSGRREARRVSGESDRHPRAGVGVGKESALAGCTPRIALGRGGCEMTWQINSPGRGKSKGG